MTRRSRIIPLTAVLTVLVISTMLYPQIMSTLKVLGQASQTFLSPELFRSLLRQTGTPLAGEQVLPPPVQSMLALIRSNRVASFRYSEAIGANEEIRQRLIEGAFPARYEPKAPYLLLVGGEQLPPACKPVASQEGVLLVQCP